MKNSYIIVSTIILLCNSVFTYTKHDFFVKQEDGIHYPAGFLKGTACSMYQNGGHNYWHSLGYKPASNWTWFENKFRTRLILNREYHADTYFELQPSSPIDRGETVGISTDGWSHMFQDIQLIKNLNCNAHRFEMPWTPNKVFGTRKLLSFLTGILMLF